MIKIFPNQKRLRSAADAKYFGTKWYVLQFSFCYSFTINKLFSLKKTIKINFKEITQY